MLPIVLHHGILGSDRYQLGPLGVNYFGKRVEGMLTGRGHPLIRSKVSKTGSVALRSRQLKQSILRQLDAMNRPKERVILIAHSMGGLDARHMIVHRGMARHVAALVTLCTPHRGSSYAEFALETIHKYDAYRFMRRIRIGLSGCKDLTRPAVAAFNEATPNHPDVKYFSVSAQTPWRFMSPFLMHGHRVVSRIEGPNDGMVAVESAKWGQHLGTWDGDHLHVVDRRLPFGDNAGGVIDRYNRLLDHVTASVA